MPNVNGRKFPYTPEGMEAARLARVKMRPTGAPYKHGGHTVPGMFKNGGLPKAQENLDFNKLFGSTTIPQIMENPYQSVQPFGNITKKVNPQTEVPLFGSTTRPGGSPIVIPAPTNPGIKTNPFQRFGRSFGNIFRGGKSPFGADVDIDIMNDPNWQQPNAPAGYAYGKRGGSTGPNGML